MGALRTLKQIEQTLGWLQDLEHDGKSPTQVRQVVRKVRKPLFGYRALLQGLMLWELTKKK